MSQGAGGVITEFLASVGFKADENSLKASLAKVAAFGAAVQMMAVGVYAGLVKAAGGEVAIADKADLLGTTSDKLQELGYVADQSGSSIDAVTKSIEALVSKNPRIKDGAKALEMAGERMRRMSEAQRKAYADNLGIDRTLIPMLISDTSHLTAEFRAMYEVAGYDAKEAAKSSREFMGEIGKLSTMAGLLAKSVALAFMGRIRHDVINLRKVIMENFDKLKRLFEGAIKLVLRVASAISAFAYRVITWVSALVSWYDKLDDGQKKVVAGAGLLLAAWKLLNAGFLATPLGLIVAGLAGIVALVDDYLTSMEGGESYFDWGPWAGTIESARSALGNVIKAVGRFIIEHQDLIQSLAKGMALFFGLKKAVGIVGLITGAFKALNLVIRANPIGLAVGLLCMAAMWVIDNWDLVKEFFIGLWESIQENAGAAADFLREQWQGLKDFFLGLWESVREKAGAVADFFQEKWQGLKDWFFSLWGGLTDVFPDLGAWAGKAVGSMRGVFGKGIQYIKDKIKSLVSFLPDWVKEKMGLTVDDNAEEPEPVDEQPEPPLPEPPLPEPSMPEPPRPAQDPEDESGWKDDGSANQANPAAPVIVQLPGEKSETHVLEREREHSETRIERVTEPASPEADAQRPPAERPEPGPPQATRPQQEALRPEPQPALAAPAPQAGRDVPEYSEADFEKAVTAALAATEAAKAPALTPTPTQAAAIRQDVRQQVTLNAKTEITVSTSDPVAAGNQVAERQTQVNADTVRHMKGAIR